MKNGNSQDVDEELGGFKVEEKKSKKKKKTIVEEKDLPAISKDDISKMIQDP
jgi:hypothetical protein